MNGGPAFPGPYMNDKGAMEVLAKQGGMTLRDYFAAKAMQTYMHDEVWNPDTYKDAAERSYRIADAMLKARANA